MKALIASAAVILATTTAGYAADAIYETTPEPAPVIETSVFSWTGPYAGLQAGYNFSETIEASAFAGGDRFSRRYIDDTDGFVAGAFAGYNFELYGAVAGVEGDLEYAFVDGDRELFGGGGDTSVDVNLQGSLRARLGFALDRILVYGTGGVAIADIEYEGTFGGAENTDGDTEVGYTVGAGAEYAFTDNIFVRGEYRFTDYGDTDFDAGGTDFEFDTQFHTVRAGIGYKF